MNNEKTYYVYIVKCADGTLYTGFTTNIERRINEHNYSIKKAAKYTRSRRPVSLVHNEEYKTMSEALKREHAIKKLSRKRKIELIEKGM
tara:strand:- start:370 stop:636 length:267 start_codon:yes stop_codon:yes gene_type:complete